MITIEVLVAMLILFLVIATSFSNIKFFNIVNDKKSAYEDAYMNVLSLKDKLSSSICKTDQREQGVFNEMNYVATCQKQKELRTFNMGFEIGDPSGNFGGHLIKLYKINLQLNKDKLSQEYDYYITTSERINDQ